MPKQLIIGDIHGCYAEFQELLDRAALTADDEIIALGDIVDRGPDTPRVLKFFREHTTARAIQGNHERKHWRWFYGEIKSALSQRITRLQLGEEEYPAAVAFMQSFPLYLDLPEAILAHGYWEPGRGPAQQRETVLAGTMSGEAYLRKNYAAVWYELYDGDKPLIVGHHDYQRNRQPLIYRDKVFALDTGCCTGGALTGLILPYFRVVSVPSRANYWRQTKAPFRVLVVAPPPPPKWNDEEEADLSRLQNIVLQEHERALVHLRQNSAYDSLTPHGQGKAYAACVGDAPLAYFLHLARRGELNTERLRRYFKTPIRVKRLLGRLGV